jgi:hypothetical protein
MLIKNTKAMPVAGFLQLVQYSTLCCQDGCYYYLKKENVIVLKPARLLIDEARHIFSDAQIQKSYRM